MMKYCPGCKENKDIDIDFQKCKTYKDNRQVYCKSCRRKRYEENIDNKKQYDKNRYKNIVENDYENFRNDRKKYEQEKYENDECFRLIKIIRARIRVSLNYNNQKKPTSVMKGLGCTSTQLKQYLESKFYSNPETGEMMSWENKGYYSWHIDHIIPICNFDLSNKEEFLKAIHYTNLQPMWYDDHHEKHKRRI